MAARKGGGEKESVVYGKERFPFMSLQIPTMQLGLKGLNTIQLGPAQPAPHNYVCNIYCHPATLPQVFWLETARGEKEGNMKTGRGR